MDCLFPLADTFLTLQCTTPLLLLIELASLLRSSRPPFCLKTGVKEIPLSDETLAPNMTTSFPGSSLFLFLEVGKERTLGTRLQTWSKMADQPKTGREEYDGVCAKVRITKVFFECENIVHFSLVSLNWKSWFCDELVWAHVRVAYCLVMSAGLMCHVTWMCAKRPF